MYATLHNMQVGSQPATEALPLVMEPESRLYSCPVVVLDFQSLYPSLVIAYNLCYTTMVGRPTHAAASVAAATAAAAANSTQPGSTTNTQGTPGGGGGAGGGTPGLFGSTPSQPQQQPPGVGIRMGVSSYSPPVAALAPGGAADPERLVIAPNGVAFLPQRVRPGVLPRLLHEILATRVMVKAAMKRSKADKVGRGVLCAGANAIGTKWNRHGGLPFTLATHPPFAHHRGQLRQVCRHLVRHIWRLCCFRGNGWSG